MKRIGFIGLGLMGAPMAANVARAGFPLTAFNRSSAKGEPLRMLGASLAATPRQVAAASDVVICMLSDVSAMRQVLGGEHGLLAGGRRGMTLIEMSTVSPEQARATAAEVAGSGWLMLDAPVFGSTGPAKEGKLGIMVGGESSDFEAQRDVLATMGTFIWHLGPVGSGALAKLCVNLMVAAQITSLAEAMVLAGKGGLSPEALGTILRSSPLVSNLIERKIGPMASGDFAPAFPLKHLHKDLGLLSATAKDLGAPLPATEAIQALFDAARADGLGEMDSAAVYCRLASMAGLESTGVPAGR
jgi:3-hydroxyisobutyrate dehydrogenase-like beta-hydroxyacid dehydrogenase